MGKPPKSREGRNSGDATIDVCDDALSCCFAMLELEVLEQPGDKVVFECAFDALVEEVGGKEFVDVGVGEVIGKRLGIW